VNGDAFTLTATAADAAVVDATRYLDRERPCLEAISTAQKVQVEEALGEEGWRLYRHASARVGIRTSLF
jgi:hypothetical protein